MIARNEMGQIKPGYLADMILMDGNPVANVKKTMGSGLVSCIEGIFRVPYCKENSSVPELVLAAHFHWVFHWVIPDSQLLGSSARR